MRHPKHVRAFATDLELRGTDRRTLTGRAVPYNETATISEWGSTFRERFLPGAFARSIAERGAAGKIKLLANHDQRSFPIGRVQRTWEASDGLYIEAPISRTQAGDEALTLIDDGVVTGLSVGFRVPPGGEQFDQDGTREIVQAALLEVSATAFPAYDGAQIGGVRSLATIRSQLDELAGIRPAALPGGRSLALAKRGLDLLGVDLP